jgi:hypothetical protein
MRLLQVQEPIYRVHSSRSLVPQAFIWRTRQHRVRKIDEVKDEMIERAQGSAIRRIYRLQTHTGMRCSISYDERRQYWRMETVHPKGI